MQQFEIVLKNDKTKSYHFIALLLVLLNLAVFIFLLVAKIHFYEASAAVLLIGLYIIYQVYAAKKNNISFNVNQVTFFVLAGTWVSLQNYLAAFACAVTGILYHLSLQKLKFVFNENCVMRMNFPAAEYSWNKLSNVILKDNILTIDFNNNKLIQAEIENEGNIDETNFNKFVQACLNTISYSQ